MKFLLVLLACVAAANASYYVSSTYTYQYYCAHQFHVYPPTKCYHYTIYFPTTWCSSGYYSNILKAYPADDCKERSVSDVTSEVSNILKYQRSVMCGQMYRARDAYVRKIDQIHCEFKAWYKKYLYMYYTYRYSYCGYVGYISIRDNRIVEYCSKLDATKKDIIGKYNAAIASKITLLTDYHNKVIKAITDCLNTRLSKIAAYKVSLQKKIDEYVSKFYQLHCSIAQKNRDHYRGVLRDLFYRYSSSWWVNWKASISVSYYYSRQKSKVYYLARDYRCKLESYRSQLISYYACAYKCYFSTGCLNFASKSYYSHCKSLGRWFVYKSTYCYDRYCLAPFKIKFTPCTYKTLKTCDVNAAVGDISGVVSELERQRDSIISTNDAKYQSWRRTWVGYFFQYKNAFWRIVIDRHNFLCAWRRRQYIFTCGYLSSVQLAALDQMKNDLLVRASRECASYYGQLIASLNRTDKTHAETQQKFKDAFNTLISQLKAKFEACKSTRATKIAEYKKKLEDSRNAQRSALYSKLWKARNDHWNKFCDMIIHYHGSCWYKYYYVRYMSSCYSSHISGTVNSVMAEFDAFWRSMIPRLVTHFACCYKCTVSAKFVPTYSTCAFYSWKYCLPTYATYTYQYSCWYRYHTCIKY